MLLGCTAGCLHGKVLWEQVVKAAVNARLAGRRGVVRPLLPVLCLLHLRWHPGSDEFPSGPHAQHLSVGCLGLGALRRAPDSLQMLKKEWGREWERRWGGEKGEQRETEREYRAGKALPCR